MARDLQSLKHDLTALKAETSGSATSGRLDSLTSLAQSHARRAASLTDDLFWRVWSHAPVVGSTLHVTAGVSREARLLTDHALPQLVAAAKVLPQLRDHSGRIDVATLGAQAPGLRDAASTLLASQLRLSRLPHSRVRQLDRGLQQLDALLADLEGRTRGLAVAATVGPDVLGFDGTRHYLVAVQNNAEARASGGIVGAYGLLRVVGGQAVLEKFGPDSDLRQVPRNVVDLGPEWRRRYDELGAARDWREVTATPDFPSAAKVMLSLWAATHSGQVLDGVLSVDPPGLADILQATGPLAAKDGSRLAADSVVQHTLSDAYRLFPDKTRRSAVLSHDAETVFAALTTGAGDTLSLGERLGHAAQTGHLKFYASRPLVQDELATTTVAGALPTTAAPYLSVVTQDGNNDKLSYYLRRDISYDGTVLADELDFGDGRGPQPQELATVTVRLRNTAPGSGLPDYVAPRTDLSTGRPIPPGRMRVAVSVYLGRNGQLEAATVDGTPRGLTSQTEQGMAVFTTAVDIDPGSSTTLVLRVRQPTRVGQPLLVVQQPLVIPDTLVVRRRDVLRPGAFN